MVADSSFQRALEYVTAFDGPDATHYLVKTLQNKQQISRLWNCALRIRILSFSGFHSMVRLGVLLLFLDCISQHFGRLFSNNSPVTPVGCMERGTVSYRRPALEPGPLDPGNNALLRPPRLHASTPYYFYCIKNTSKTLDFKVQGFAQ